MTFSVFRCDPIQRGQRPQNEVEVATGFETAGAAMDAANEMKRADRQHSYTVG